jgi:hypothetical protein
MYPQLDIFQQKKFERMKILLEEIEQRKKVSVKEFLSSIAVSYGIRRKTGLEYISDWVDGEYISVQNGVITFLKKPKEWK